MAISYPLTPPTSPGVRRVTISAENVVSAVTSIFTLQTQTQEYEGRRWHLSATFPPMKRAYAEDWLAFFLKLRGRNGTFLFGDPNGSAPRGSGLGTPLVDGASQTGLELATKGWTPSSSGVLLPGDYIQLGSAGTSRLYKVLTQADSDSAGEVTLDIWPSLREPPSDSAAITLDDAVGLFRMADNLTQWDLDVAAFYGFGFRAEEAI